MARLTGRRDLRDDVVLAADLVTSAGKLAAQMRRRGVKPQQKRSISDVVTVADHAAEQLIVDHLEAWRPDDGILGEEGAVSESRNGRRWIIDPVDGTYNFVRGLSWWCSAIALVDGEKPVLGAVYHPHEDALYIGGPRVPSMRNGVPLGRIPDEPLGETCAATYLTTSYLGTEVGEAFQRAAGGAAALRMLGSGSMDAMAIAQGFLGVSFQHSVPDWDWFPGYAILLGVGGVGRRTSAAGVEWSVMGAPRAVDDICSRLEDR